MKNLLLSFLFICLYILSGCGTSFNNSSDQLSNSFYDYQESRHLNIYQQTIPEENEKSLLAIYETTYGKVGLVEYSTTRSVHVEKVKESFTILPLKGQYGNYVGVKYSPSHIKNVEKVRLSTSDGDVIKTYRFHQKESFAFFSLDQSNAPSYKLSLLNKDDEPIETKDVHF